MCFSLGKIIIPKKIKRNKKRPNGRFFIISGGEEGIRTLDTVARIHDFESRAFDHSATSPRRLLYLFSFYLQGVYNKGIISRYENI